MYGSPWKRHGNQPHIHIPKISLDITMIFILLLKLHSAHFHIGCANQFSWTRKANRVCSNNLAAVRPKVKRSGAVMKNFSKKNYEIKVGWIWFTKHLNEQKLHVVVFREQLYLHFESDNFSNFQQNWGRDQPMGIKSSTWIHNRIVNYYSWWIFFSIDFPQRNWSIFA